MAMPALMGMATHPLAPEQAIHLQALTEFLMDMQQLRTGTRALKVFQTGTKDHPTGIPDKPMDIQVLQMDIMALPMDT